MAFKNTVKKPESMDSAWCSFQHSFISAIDTGNGDDENSKLVCFSRHACKIRGLGCEAWVSRNG